MENCEYKETNFGIAFIQCITFIISYVIISSIIGIICMTIANLIGGIPFLSWLTIDHIIRMAGKYTIISWDFANWVWCDAIMFIALLVMFYKRTKFAIKDQGKE